MMSCNDVSPWGWRAVPDGSSLELSLVPSDERYAQTVRFITNSQRPGTNWSRSEVTPGPKAQLLSAGNTYDIEVVLTFQSQERTSVQVQAQIIHPNGSVHGRRTFCEVLSGTSGDIKESLITIFMKVPS